MVESGVRVQVDSGVTRLTTSYQSVELRNTLSRMGGPHEGTEAYKLRLSEFARSVLDAEKIVAASLRGNNLYTRN